MRMRDEPFDPATIINDTNGEALHEEGKIMKRWENYFNYLLKPLGFKGTRLTVKVQPQPPRPLRTYDPRE